MAIWIFRGIVAGAVGALMYCQSLGRTTDIELYE